MAARRIMPGPSALALVPGLGACTTQIPPIRGVPASGVLDVGSGELDWSFVDFVEGFADAQGRLVKTAAREIRR